MLRKALVTLTPAGEKIETRASTKSLNRRCVVQSQALDELEHSVLIRMCKGWV